ncbi:hypothetical protein CPC08DRAFT_818848 [Agrocybe pediades]|nr:hypothetical protein CPC08DRAFT_818848 [Agrocybe pediades]
MKLATILSTVLAASGAAMSSTVAELVRRQTACSPGSTVPNPVILTVNAGVSVSVSAESHAANLQQLTVFPGHAGSTFIVFQGSGEDVPMPIVSGGTGTGFSLPAQSTEFQLALLFAFSTNNGNTLTVPTVRCPVVTNAGTITINTVTSEDSSDNDDNDTIATVVFS